MKNHLRLIILSILCVSVLCGCTEEDGSNPTEPVSMAGALFILEYEDLHIDAQYTQDVLTVFMPSRIETILHNRLAESNFLSGESDFIGTHNYQLLVSENFIHESAMPDYVYFWIEDLNVLKKIYFIEDTLCDFDPEESMETERLDETVGILYEGTFVFEENTEVAYAKKEDFVEEFTAFEEIVTTQVPLLATEEPASITIYVMNGFPWELEAGSVQAYADIRYENGDSDIYEVHLAYEENGQMHLESQHIGNSMEDFPEVDKQVLYEYTLS